MWKKLCLLLLLCGTLAGPAAESENNCLTLSRMNDPSEWKGPFPAKTVKRKNGGKALVFDFGKGGSGDWILKNFPGRKIDLDSYDLLRFDYRIENGSGYFSIRFRQWPFMGGFLALGHHIDPPFHPEKWQTMTFNIHEPENAGSQSYSRHDSRMYLSFNNIIADPGKNVRVFVDNVRLVRQQFSVECDIDDLYLDFGKRRDLPDGTSVYTYTLKLYNRTGRELPVKLTLDTSKLKFFSAASKENFFRLPPKGSANAVITVTVPKSAKTGLSIAYSEETFARFSVSGDPSSEHTVTLLAAVPFKEKSHPYLFATSEQIRNAKARMKKWGWAKAAANEYLKRAGFAMHIPPGLPKYEVRPEQPGDKICPVCKDKTRLRPIVISNPCCNECQYRYQCETCGKMLSSKLWKGKELNGVMPRYRESGYWWRERDKDKQNRGHAISFDRWGNILDLAIAWQLTGKKEYLQRVADTIREYIKVLPTYPYTNADVIAIPHFNGKGGVKVGNYFSQTDWLHRMACTLDLVWDSGALTDKEKHAILNELTQIVYQRLRMWSPGYSNHRTTAAGLGVALLSDNAPLLAYVLNDQYSGVHAFFRDNLYPDGFTNMAGQYMDPVILAWMPIFNTLRNAGIDLAKQYPAFRRFGISIQEWLDPDGLSPDMGDSWSSRCLQFRDWFEKLYAWTGNPKLIVPVQRDFFNIWKSSKRRIKWEDIKREKGTLFWGTENIPRGNPELPRGSYNFPDCGLLIFNQGESDKRLWAAVPYGKLMGHGHHDNLHLEWWALGQKMSVKQGSRGRKHAIHVNTLLVDQKDQFKLPCKVSGFVNSGPVQGALISSENMYPGTRVRRMIMLYNGLIFLLDLFDGKEKHLYDMAYMNAGTAHCSLPFKLLGKPLGTERNMEGTLVGYGSLLDVEKAPAPKELKITWNNLGIAKDCRVRQTQISLDGGGSVLRVMMPLVKQHRQWERLTGDLKAAGYRMLPWDRLKIREKRYLEFLAPKFIYRFDAKRAGLLTILEPCRGKTSRVNNLQRLPLTVNGKQSKEGIALRYTDEKGVEHQIIMCPEKGIKKAGNWTIKGPFTAGTNGPLTGWK